MAGASGTLFSPEVRLGALVGLMGALLAFSLLLLARRQRDQAERQGRPQAGGHLKETEDRFRTLVAGIRDYAIFMMDPQGRITTWNPGAERLTGYTESEALGQHFSRFFPEEEVAAGRPAEILREVAEKGRLEDEAWRVRKDGTRFLANGIFTAFHDARGVLQGFAKITRDVTEQRATQAALQNLAETLEEKVQAQVHELRESEARLQGFFRHSPAAIAFKGLDLRFLLLNPRMEAALGRPAREIVGRTNAEVFPPGTAEHIEALDREVLRSRQDLQTEEQVCDAQGATHHFITNLFPLEDTTGQCWGLGVIATDITERLLANQALLQTQKLESLGVLAGGIAHDFNNLLAAMRGNVELALMEGAPAAARPHLETVLNLMSKASDLLRQMLAYAGRGKALVTVVDLNQLVGDMAELLATSISKKALLCRDLHPEPLLVEADPSQLQQVVMNLVINASEAIGEQSGTITLRTRREDLGPNARDYALAGQCLDPGRYVSLEVSDDGAGMSPEVLRKIFDPFFTTKFAGRGLGLAAIHGIVRGHRGGIRVLSEPGRGSAFKLVFPAAAGPMSPLPPEPRAPEPAPEAGPLDGMVLVVDDEAAIRGMAVKALARRSIATLQARDGREALRMFEQNQDRVRLILMDLTMPNLDGEETLRELRRRGATVPVILSSGFNEADILGRFEGLGLAGFIKKPFGLAELVALVSRTLSG